MLIKLSPVISRVQKELSKNSHSLLKHQKDGIRRLVKIEKRNNGGILADEMGLGKTIQILGLMIAKPMNNTLIIVPASLVIQWENEIKKFYPSANVSVYWGDRTFKLEQKLNIIITSYSKLIRTRIFELLKFNRIICDEAHFFRNRKSKTFKALSRLNSDIKWAITGTPIQNYLKDIKTIFSFIGNEIGCEQQLIYNIKNNMLRRTKSEVNIILPEKKEKILFVPCKHNELKLYDFVEKLKGPLEQLHHLEKLLRLRQSCIIPRKMMNALEFKYSYKLPIEITRDFKLDCIVNALRKNYKKEKSIVFTQFKQEIYYLKYYLEKYNLSVGVISGDINSKQREFVTKNVFDILLIQIVAGGTGLNLQSYDTVYFTSPNWNPSLEEQAIARVHRIGQKNNVIIKKYIFGELKTQTIEKSIISIQNNKKKLISKYIH